MFEKDPIKAQDGGLAIAVLSELRGTLLLSTFSILHDFMSVAALPALTHFLPPSNPYTHTVNKEEQIYNK